MPSSLWEKVKISPMPAYGFADIVLVPFLFTTGIDLLYPETCIAIFSSSRNAGANRTRNSARGRRR